MFFLVFCYGISTTLIQTIISLRFPIHPFKGGARLPSIGVLKKQLLRKFLHTLHTFQGNIQGGVLFKYTRRTSWDFSKKLFRATILQAGVYPSNLDVRYSAQKTQSFI